VHPSCGAHLERHLVVVAANLAHGHEQSHLATSMRRDARPLPDTPPQGCRKPCPALRRREETDPERLTAITQPAADCRP
jgi:hypothetical protein